MAGKALSPRKSGSIKRYEKQVMKRFAITTGCLAAGVLCLIGPAAQAETLMEAMVSAYNNNPILNAQRAGLRAVDEDVAQALSGYRPTITATGSLGRDEADSFFAGPGVVLKPKRMSVIAEQSVFKGFQTFNQTRAAQARVKAGRSQLLSTEQGVLLSTVNAYVDVQRDQAVLELRNNNVEVLRRQLQASRDRFEVGEITRTDVAQSEARLSGAMSGRIAAEAELSASRAAYRRIVGDMPGTLDARPSLPPLPADEEEALTVALVENPDLTGAKFSEQAARRAVSAARGALAPEVSVSAEYAKTENTFIDGAKTENKTVMARAIWPLYQGGAASSRIRQAKHTKSQRRIEVLEAEREVVEAVRNAWETLRAARSITESSKAQVRANEIALDGVRQEAEVGSRTTLDVLDAEQETLDSQVTLVRAERDAYVAGYQLLAAIGRVNATYLDLPVEAYDPTRNYRRAKGSWYGWAVDDE